MVDKLGKQAKKIEVIKEKICPQCLEKIKGQAHTNCFPKGMILVKRKEYFLLKVTKEEPIIKRMLKFCKDKQNNSKEYLLLYVNKTLVGYKGKDKTNFIPTFTEEKYKKILNEYIPRNERKKNTFESPMWHSYSSTSQSISTIH